MHELLKTFIDANRGFLFQKIEPTTSGPHIRDGIDLKRVMILVVFALIPCILMAIWNTGVQSFVYGSFEPTLLLEYYQASNSFSGYFEFAWKYLIPIFLEGIKLFLPILLITYAVGGLWETIFATIRKEEISEGFLVTGILYALILPPTLPYWMVALGVSFGVIIGKELFGGTGMNILNPALVCRCFLYFAFPAYLTGQVWVGESSNTVRESLSHMTQEIDQGPTDGFTLDSMLTIATPPFVIKRIHSDAAALAYTPDVENREILKDYLQQYDRTLSIDSLSSDQLHQFITSDRGLGLASEYFNSACEFARLKYNIPIWTNVNFFFGNMIGSVGETSTFACLLGALLLIVTGIGSWITMLAVLIGALGTAVLFQLGSHLGPINGVWNPASFDLPAYKQLLLGGLAFGLVFMATDPVSSPTRPTARWIFGLLIGGIIIVIRLINPAFPEGVMLAILFGNVFAPLLDRIAIKWYRRPIIKQRKRAIREEKRGSDG